MKTYNYNFNCTACAMEGLCSLPHCACCTKDDNCGYYNIGLYIENQRAAFRKEWYQYSEQFYN